MKNSASNLPIPFLLLIFISLAFPGCATTPYRYTSGVESAHTLRLDTNEKQIEIGRQNIVIDSAGHYFFSIPSKLLLWSWEAGNHRVSMDTEDELRFYLEANGLNNVKVRLNQYAPGAEWRRLIRNKEIPWFLRYTLGGMYTTFYTILPERLFAGFFIGGGDHYNPFTNTINLYSDSIPIAFHEGGHAKDFAKKHRYFKGWYALMRFIPLVPLYQEAIATGDAIGYTIEKDLLMDQEDAYKILYPAYMTYIGGEGLQWVTMDSWLYFPVQLTVTIPGHIAGRIKAASIDEAPEENIPSR